ncbi:MAG: VWA domain-containing protein [Planctomycetia bacterium]|nr:VWA domain-containing protein [Planctomycetia bacterium]
MIAAAASALALVFGATGTAPAVVAAKGGFNWSEFEFGRLLNFGPLEWVLLVAACVAVLAVVIFIYLRDCVELGGWIAVLLIVLRIGAFLGLLWIFLQPQTRKEHEEIQNSRAILLIDVSTSIAKRDEDSQKRRIDELAEALQQGNFIRNLRQTHDVIVMTFDAETNVVKTLDKLKKQPDPNAQEEPIDWAKLLVAKGRETRLGSALRQVINDRRTEPVAGIVLFSDGRHNAGVDPSTAVAMAQTNKIVIHTVGLGSDKKPLSLRVADFQVPARAYPGDHYAVSGLIQATGMAGQSVEVEVLARDEGAPESDAEVLKTETVTLGADGEMVPVHFQLTPDKPGKHLLTFRIRPPSPSIKDSKELRDEKIIEIVEHKTRVLLFAGGPHRDFVFLRNQLQRDESMIVDVLLQTAQPGISQDANKILDVFPTSKEELYEYHCIVAFDPDWTTLNDEQVDLLEEWVAKGAGGLVCVPGPVNTDLWVHNSKDERLKKIRALYPVQFQRQFAVLGSGEFDHEKAWPVKFTAEGLSADFLWLEDNQLDSDEVWNEFEGVFGYYSVHQAKPLATVYSHYSDPSTNTGDGLPIYMAGQFYGSGRVFYMGSGEIWRLRSLSDANFETFYTKLLRHVSQGTLLRGSKRGLLLVEQDKYMLGDTVSVRAQLKNAQLDPLDVRSVTLEILNPDEKLNTLTLNPVQGDVGIYAGQFTVYQEGNYRLQLPVPDSDETLTWAIDVRLPDLENENTQRNDPLLKEIAEKTEGHYYVGLTGLSDVQSPTSLVKSLPDMKRTTTHSDRPESLWDNTWTLFIICGLLCVEWLIRRLAKLA